MRLRRAIIVSLSLLFVLFVHGIACDNVKLSMNQPLNMSSVQIKEICTSAPSAPDVPMRILFLIDMSGSNCNQSGGIACDATGTDPNRSFRFGLMNDFVSRHSTEKNLSFGAIGFSGTQAIPLTGDTQANFFRPAGADLTADLAKFQTMTDQGPTPYKAALTLAKSEIQADVAASASNPPKYYIVIISDGMPTDYGDPPDQGQIQADVQALFSIAQISTFSAIYYNQKNISEDVRLLQGIAKVGHGGFANMNTDQKYIPLEDLMAFSNSFPWWISQFFVVNLNSAPCDDGTIDVDSDSDGICDKDEFAYNAQFAQNPAQAARMGGRQFDPQSRNSFHASYGDLFFLQKIKYDQMLDLSCPLVGNLDYDDADNDLVNTCEERFLTSTTPLGITPDWTSAMQQTADPNNFDSDGDGFTDWIEFNFGRSQSAAMDSGSGGNTVRGYKMSEILTKHLHPTNPEGSVAYDGVLKFSETNSAGQNCYTYSQTNLKLYKTLPVRIDQVSGYSRLAHAQNENVVLLYFIERPGYAMNGPGRLRYYYQKIDSSLGGYTLELDSSKYQVFDPVNSRVAMKLNQNQ